MEYYAVIDTNVFISALLSKRTDAATVRVLEAMFDGKIVPLYHNDILAEYDEGLHRSFFIDFFTPFCGFSDLQNSLRLLAQNTTL